MSFYHFYADGFERPASEFCPDRVGAERVALSMCLDLSRAADRIVVVTVRDAEGSEICRVPKDTTRGEKAE